MKIHSATGEIEPLERPRTELSPPLFQEQFKSYAALSERQSEVLAGALN